MADDLSLLFRLRADNQQAKASIADTRAAVAQLRQSFGPQLSQSVSITNQAFSDLGANLQNFVSQRVPLVGGAIVQVTEGLKGFAGQGAKTEKAVAGVAKSIESIAIQSGKSVPQITTFLTRFTQIQGQTERNEAAFKFFGGSVDLVGNKTAKFVPELEKASAALVAASAETTAAGSSIAALAGPVGIAVIALAALAAGAVIASKEIFALAKASAEYQGKLFDLSQQVGVSVETLSALEVVARTTGSSVESLAQSLGIFQKNLEEASETSDSKAAKAFKNLGVETTDTETALRQTIAALARMPEGFRQTAAALEVFGRGGKAFLAIAKETNGDIDEITKRLKGLGLVTTEQARLADEFNDQLVLLDVQLRGLGTQAIPVVLGVLKDLSKALEDNRDLVGFLQGGVKGLAVAIAIPLRGQIVTLKTTFEAILPVLKVTAETFERIAAAMGLINQTPTKFLEAGVQAPTLDLGEADFQKQQQETLKGLQKLQGVLNFEFAAQQRQAQAAIAQAQRDFEAGRKTRADLLEATIAGLRKQTKAQVDALQADRSIKLKEQALAKDDVQKQTQLSNQILTIDTQIADKRHQLREREKDEREKFRKEQESSELAHQERLLTNSATLDQVRIAQIRQAVSLGKQAALAGDKEIENIELTAIDRAQNLLVKRLEIAGLDLAKQKEIKDEIARLNAERTATEQRHSDERLQIVIREGDVALQRTQLQATALIATIEALASARVISEEEAQRRIAAAQLKALDVEIELLRSRGEDVRLLLDQRKILQAQSEREIEAGRQRDLQNEREYGEELRRLQQETQKAERKTAEEIIRLMIANFARRKDIIRAQRDLELAEEDDRHRRGTESLNQQKRGADEEIRILEKRLERLEIGTTEEIEEHDRLIESLERLRAKRAQLEAQQAAEDERTEARTGQIEIEGERADDEADPLGRLELDGDRLKEFAAELEESIVPLNQILSDSFSQVADAIGSVVEQWVLLGETGPGVMRKMLAVALASLAREATVNAIKELALGFATLFFNPAESAAHFTSAAIWGSIAGGAAIAGRGVAGDLFKNKPGGAGEGSSGSQPGQIAPASLARNQGAPPNINVQIQMSGEATAAFDYKIVKIVDNDFRGGGTLRDTFNNDGGVS